MPLENSNPTRESSTSSSPISGAALEALLKNPSASSSLSLGISPSQSTQEETRLQRGTHPFPIIIDGRLWDPELGRELSKKLIKEEVEKAIKSQKINQQVEKSVETAVLNQDIPKQVKEILDQKTPEFIRDSQIKSIEMLGIFAALLSFISIDISLLKNSQNFELSVSLIALSGAILIGFILLMEVILFPLRKNTKGIVAVLVVVTVLFISGFYFLEKALNVKNDQQTAPEVIKFEQTINQKNKK